MKKICIYGCGMIGKEAIEYYKQRNDMEISCLCDSNSDKWGEVYCGKKIVSPKELVEQENKIDLIVVATVYVNDVILTLSQIGATLSKVRIYRSGSAKEQEIDEFYRKRSWSQEGEDIWLQERFRNEKGFYVDVGALHPYRFSNTAWAYEKGWHGINIEPNIDCFRLFEIFRPKDININCGVSDQEGEMTYYCFEDPALNGFDANAHADFPVRERRTVKVRPLADILKENKVNKVDFLDIDVEGLELSVLKSIDFSIDIDCILIEQHVKVDSIVQTLEYQFLKEKGYDIIAKYRRTAVYERKRRLS